MDWWTQRSDNAARATRGRFSRPSVSEITCHLLVGEYPRLGDLEWLKVEHRVTAIHNLQDEMDLHINGLDGAELRSECERLGLRFVHTPIHDGSADDMAIRLEPALHAIAWLHTAKRKSLEEAMVYFKQRRPCGPFMTVLEGHFGPRHLRPAG